ncbi:nuclear-interacting partner of ALK-like [Gigantopelta aegis]|uniref:nuclear-interacting partner of ALK-like n=1 Tax=Gigantopelta aegis TaxID=1735272 RepID=UPI001B88D96F|nr:nuclear-interacting partner of ALK-like [Gigantopelta aegis]
MSCHVKSCSWFSNPTSDSYKEVPHCDQKEVRNEFKGRLNQLKKMTDSLPHINYESLQKWNFCSSRCAQFAYHVEKMDTETVKAAITLAVTGWASRGRSDVIICSHCRRHVGLWNFRAIAPGQQTSGCHGDDDGSGDEPAPKRQKIQTKIDFDPIAEHRNWCPWITKSESSNPSKPVRTEGEGVLLPESSSGTSAEQDDGTDPTAHPGWLLVVQILAPRLLNASNISFSKSLKQSPIVAGLRSIRHLFSDWTTSTVTNR